VCSSDLIIFTFARNDMETPLRKRSDFSGQENKLSETSKQRSVKNI
jgi:hypothetical protein